MEKQIEEILQQAKAILKKQAYQNEVASQEIAELQKDLARIGKI